MQTEEKLTEQNKQKSSYPEHMLHDDGRMPMRYYNCRIPETFRYLAPHWHNEMEIGVITDGQAVYQIHGKEYPVSQGDLILLEPQCIHSIQQREDLTMESDNLVFHLDYLGLQNEDDCTLHYLRPLGTEEGTVTPVVHPGDVGYWPIWRRVTSAMTLYMEQSAFYELTLKADLLLLIADLYRWGYIKNEKRPAEQTEAEEKLRQVLGYIQAHFQDRPTVHQLAEICDFSDTHFIHFFQNSTGLEPVDYLNQYCLEQAASRIRESNLPVSGIAFQCGWRSIAAFNRQFREKYGMAPRDYRRAYRSADLDR